MQLSNPTEPSSAGSTSLGPQTRTYPIEQGTAGLAQTPVSGWSSSTEEYSGDANRWIRQEQYHDSEQQLLSPSGQQQSLHGQSLPSGREQQQITQEQLISPTRPYQYQTPEELLLPSSDQAAIDRFADKTASLLQQLSKRSIHWVASLFDSGN